MAKRIELKHSDVIFNEDDHTYFLNGKQLSGITSLLDRQLFSDIYAGISEEILIQAAEYGKSVHESIEDFDMNWENDGTQEVQDYISLCTEHSLVHEESEYLISDNESYASMIDKVYRIDEITFDIGDLKTYGVMTADKLEKAKWQLSIYAYLFELQNKKAKVRNLFILHIRNKMKKDGDFDHISAYIPVQRIPNEIIKELLLADSKGEQFNNPYSIPSDIASQESTIRKLIQVKQDAETRLNSIKARILSQMEALDVKSWATDTMRITRKSGSTRSSFSLDAFKTEHPEIDVEPFMKISEVKSSLLIAI